MGRLEMSRKKYDSVLSNIAKKLGIITFVYIPHLFFILSLIFRELNEMEILMIFLIFVIELLLIAILIKEIYDLVFLEESQRDFEIEENRKKYVDKKNNT